MNANVDGYKTRVSTTILNNPEMDNEVRYVLYVQYTIESSWVFNAILQCTTVYFTWLIFIQCALILHCIAFHCKLTLHRMHVEKRVLYPTISKRYCLIQHTEVHDAIYLQFTIESSRVFNAILRNTTIYLTLQKCIHCALTLYCIGLQAYIAQNARLKHSLVSDNIEPILPSTSMYMHNEVHNTLYVQYIVDTSWVRIALSILSLFPVLFGWFSLPSKFLVIQIARQGVILCLHDPPILSVTVSVFVSDRFRK